MEHFHVIDFCFTDFLKIKYKEWTLKDNTYSKYPWFAETYGGKIHWVRFATVPPFTAIHAFISLLQ